MLILMLFAHRISALQLGGDGLQAQLASSSQDENLDMCMFCGDDLEEDYLLELAPCRHLLCAKEDPLPERKGKTCKELYVSTSSLISN